MRNIPNIDKLTGIIELFLENNSRANEAKETRYWYPLSIATYGVPEILQALDSLCSFRTSMWEKTLEFERRYSAYQGSADSIMVNSGSSADLLACHLLTNPTAPILKPGDEILVPVVTWPTQIWSAMMAGLKVRLVDVSPQTLNVDLADLERAITPATKAIFLVHLMGNPCDMDAIGELAKKHNLVILEDCCEALGAEFRGTKVGNFGIAGTFSFFFAHHLVTMEGGMVVCQQKQHAKDLKIMRAHGWVRNVDSPEDKEQLSERGIDPRYAFYNWGFNLRPTELQAGFGLCQLEKIEAFNQQRNLLAARFFKFIDANPWLSRPEVHPQALPSWFTLPLMLSPDAPFTREDLTRHLEEEGVETRPIVAGNIARHPVSEVFPAFKEREFPGADEIHHRGFYIGLSPLYDEAAIDRLIAVFGTFLQPHTSH
jgi:CDP-6-deoxy-D-xylo-4-hexulose-3-dehydrase